jgi:DNA-binding PadR family transcriptional regulator
MPNGASVCCPSGTIIGRRIVVVPLMAFLPSVSLEVPCLQAAAAGWQSDAWLTNGEAMNSRDFALAALAGTDRRPMTPVQVQKFFFLLDRNIGQHMGGSGFAFRPYHYGPFDSTVYVTLEALANDGLAEIDENAAPRRTFRLTDRGQTEGERLLEGIPAPIKEYIEKIGDFVRAQSFAGLVSAVYKAYPEMRVNSVFGSNG